MKVAVSASWGSLEAPLDPRFGRCPFFLIVDTETMAFESVANSNVDSPSGAGIGAAQIIVNKGVEAVLTGAVGPNAMKVLSNAGIRIFVGLDGTVRQSVEAFKRGELKEAPAAGYGGFYGRRVGRVIGMGRGMVRGGGISYSQYQPPTGINPSALTIKEEERGALEKELDVLERRLSEVKKRLEELER